MCTRGCTSEWATLGLAVADTLSATPSTSSVIQAWFSDLVKFRIAQAKPELTSSSSHGLGSVQVFKN